MPRQIVSNRFGALLFSFQNIGSSAPPWAHKLQAGAAGLLRQGL